MLWKEERSSVSSKQKLDLGYFEQGDAFYRISLNLFNFVWHFTFQTFTTIGWRISHSSDFNRAFITLLCKTVVVIKCSSNWLLNVSRMFLQIEHFLKPTKIKINLLLDYFWMADENHIGSYLFEGEGTLSFLLSSQRWKSFSRTRRLMGFPDFTINDHRKRGCEKILKCLPKANSWYFSRSR